MSEIDNVPLDKVLFVDVETVSQAAGYSELDEYTRGLWEQKGSRFARQSGEEWGEEVAARTYRERAAIFAEFGKAVVISAGFLHGSPDNYQFKLKSFAGQDEKQVLSEFSSLLRQHYNDPARNFICGHNIKEFDVPYLCRRMIIHGMPLPRLLDLTGKKPWETKHVIDTMNLWKFGDFKNYTSLALLAHVLGVPTPKDDIDGSDVGRVFWEDGDLDRIARYCEKDVVTCAQIVLRMRGESLLKPEQITSVTANE